ERVLQAVLPLDGTGLGGGSAPQGQSDQQGQGHRAEPFADRTSASNSGANPGGWSQKDSGCHCTPTTNRLSRRGISIPSTTPSGLWAETTRPLPICLTA